MENKIVLYKHGLDKPLRQGKIVNEYDIANAGAVYNIEDVKSKENFTVFQDEMFSSYEDYADKTCKLISLECSNIISSLKELMLLAERADVNDKDLAEKLSVIEKPNIFKISETIDQYKKALRKKDNE